MSEMEFRDLAVRQPVADDHPSVLRVLDRWWGGFEGSTGSVQRALLLPRLFFQHFADSSFIAERDGELVGFLVGFLSQSRHDESYVHFVGVSPEEQRGGLGRYLYGLFFDYSRGHGRSVVRAITSAANSGSYEFHTRMGFDVEPSPAEFEGRPVQPDYDGPGLDRVSFVRRI
ncbi:GNAT family N-acetyltransferase [Peterkaempfera bronchialis]|uniref:GNAT family N-acetyltransferase n=1 Tax=Peterkaempfera bronchialis TaxID=2126346 RepID=UPI003C304C29